MIQHWRNLGKLPRSCWYLALATLINRAGTMVLPFMALYLTRQQGISAAKAGFVLATYGIGAMVTAPISGRLADRYGNVTVMRGSLVLSCALLLVFPYFKSYLLMVVGTFVYAMFNESFRPASGAAVASLVPSADRKQAFVLMRLAINLGMSVGPALGGILAAYSFHWIFLVDAATAAVAAFVVSHWLANTSKDTTPPETIADETVAKTAYRDRHMLVFAFAVLLNAIILFQNDSTLPLYVVNELGMHPFQYGLLVTVNTICVLLFEVSLNQMTAHWSHRRSLVLSTFLWGAGFGALVFAHNFWTVVLTIVIWTVGEMIGAPSQSAYVSEIAPKNRQGEYMGLFTMTYGLGYVLAPLLGTQIMQHWGSQTLWITIFCLGCFSALLVSRIRMVSQQAR